MLFPKVERGNILGASPITNKNNAMYWSIRFKELILYIHNKYINVIFINIKQ